MKKIDKKLGAKPEKVKVSSATPPPSQPSFSFQWAYIMQSVCVRVCTQEHKGENTSTFPYIMMNIKAYY